MTSTNGEDNDVRPTFRLLESGKVLLIALACVFASTAARAATIIVDGTQCTLAEAIMAANTNVATGGCRAGNDHNNGGDVIDLQVDVILTNLDNIDADGCGNGLPTVSSRIRING